MVKEAIHLETDIVQKVTVHRWKTLIKQQANNDKSRWDITAWPWC